MVQFPKDFFWGAATSAHQVEGDNKGSDWWEWEKGVGLKETSGRACRHYEFYREDFDLARALSHNCHRLSVEWSRLEPEEGRFSQKELDHYQDVILALKERNLQPLVTLHHFTNPLWFSKIGGWQNKKAPFYFLRYVEKITGTLCENVRYWVTINEPLVYVYHAYILGVWPPQKSSILLAQQVEDNFAVTHIKAYQLIHNIYQKRNLKSPLVTIAKNTQAFLPCRPILKDKFAVYLRNRWFNFKFLERLIRHQALDFIGINYYARQLVEVESWGIRHLILDVCKNNHHPLEKNSLGWDIYPEGLSKLLLKFKKYNLPIFILENGVCTADDNLRWEYIRGHLKNVHLAMDEGVKVLGYIYWSLIDNYEWDKGFSPRFGLIGVDFTTYKRTVRESARKFALVCKTGRLD